MARQNPRDAPARTIDRDLDLELDAWVAELAARHQARGLPAEEARRRALIETEGQTQVRDLVRDERPRWFFDPDVLERRWFDFTTACRSLLATPVTTLATIATLASAVGVNLAMAGLIGRALLSPPVDVADPARVFTVSFHDAQNPKAMLVATSYPMFTAVRDAVRSQAAVAGFERASTTVTVQGDPRHIDALYVTPEYFGVLGARAWIGRTIGQAEDDNGAATPVAVLSNDFWRTAFGGNRDVLGQRFVMGGADYTVIGVMPRGFSGHATLNVDVWTPLSSALRDRPGWQQDQYRSLVTLVAHVAATGTTAAAESQMSAASGQLARLASIVGADVGATEQRIAWWLAGVSGLILVMGLANGATLLVVRAAARGRDAAIRAALGASRGRLAIQALAEAAVLSAIVIAISMLAASWMDEMIRRVLFPDLVGREGFSATSLAVAAIAGVATLAVTAIASARQLRAASHPDRTRLTRDSSRPTRWLLIVQTTVSVVLLAGAAMFGQSLRRLTAQDFGMTMDGVVIAQFEMGGGPPLRGDVFVNALPEIRTLPGVEAATVTSSMPFGSHTVLPISVPGLDKPPSVGGQLPFLNAATPEFLSILGIQMIEGRRFTASDDRGELVAIVNETMAREVWPGKSAIGKCIRIGFDADFDPAAADGPPIPSDAVPCRRVIGVARDVRQRSLLPVDQEAKLMQYFVPLAQVPPPAFGPPATALSMVSGLLIKSSASLDVLAPAVRRIIAGGRPDAPFLQVIPYLQTLDRQSRPWRLGTTLFGLFSALALGVAAIGLYASFAQAVAERRREMAIRLAIGARPAGLIRLVMGEALRLTTWGIVIGAVVAAIAGRWIQSLLFETSPTDPLVLGAAALAMLAMAAAATVLPARAAAKADPNSLLHVL